MKEIPDDPDWHEAPERVYVVLDDSHPTGADYLQEYGTTNLGAALIEEVLVDRTPAPPDCRFCGNADRPTYRPERASGDDPVCLQCFRELEFVEAVVPEFSHRGSGGEDVEQSVTLEGVDVSMDYLNAGFDVDEELFVMQTGGDARDLSDRVCALLFREGYSEDSLESGDWVTIVDGEVVNIGTTHPFRISVTRE